MGIKALQDFLEANCASACVSVDLLKLSRGFLPKRRHKYGDSNRFCLVVDAESCLDRLYGGFFSDWVCGGQWNRMTCFLSSLMQACHSANMELVVFFNGALENQSLDDWATEQQNQKKKASLVAKHVHNKGTPPPKVWWTPPVFLRGSLRMALRQLNVTVACSMDDHHQEVIAYCREYGLQGIVAQDSMYAIFDPPRYFCSNNLKLTYKGSLETKEYIMSDIAKCLNLHLSRFCLFAALLGNHILSDEDLVEFFKDEVSKATEGKPTKLTPEKVIKAVVDYVRKLSSIDNLDAIGEDIFKNSNKNKQELIKKLKQSVQYYLNGTKDGFLKYKPRVKISGLQRQNNYGMHNGQNRKENTETSGYADSVNPQIVIDPPNQVLQDKVYQSGDSSKNSADNTKTQSQGKGDSLQNKELKLPQISPEIMRIASERHQKGLMAPWVYQLLSQGEIKLEVCLEDDVTRELPSYVELYRPVRQTLYSVLFNLNKLKIIHENQNKDKGDKCFEVGVKEWVIRKGVSNAHCEVVIARPVDWKTPSIERLWLGQQADDKNRRLRAFLTCLKSDTPLMLNTSYVPQHLLLMCCVHRYILQTSRVLQRQELDAFLAMAVSPLLHDIQIMQDLKLPSINNRGVHLASLFMAGIETAIFANDICGAPIPWTMCCPWLYFDGKLFHFKLLKANNNTPLIDMCDGQVDQVLKVERMRQAIMEGLKVEFAKPPMLPCGQFTSYPFPAYQNVNYGHRPLGVSQIPSNILQSGQNQNKGRGRGILGRSPVDARGGQLEIAGVVVGSWGPNLHGAARGRASNMAPQVMSVGGPGKRVQRGAASGRALKGKPSSTLYGMGRGIKTAHDNRFSRGRGFRPAARRTLRARPKPGNKSRNVKGTGAVAIGRGRGCTVEITGESGSAVVSVSQFLSTSDNDKHGKYSNADEKVNSNSAISPKDKKGSATKTNNNNNATTTATNNHTTTTNNNNSHDSSSSSTATKKEPKNSSPSTENIVMAKA